HPRHGSLRVGLAARPRPSRDDPARHLHGNPVHRRELVRRRVVRRHRPANPVRLMALTTADTRVTGGDKVEGISAWGIAWRRIRRDPGAIIAASVIVALILVAIFAPQISPWDPTRPDRAVSF